MSKEAQKTMPRLGKGLEALIPRSFIGSGKTITNIPVSEIRPNPFQPRLHFNEEQLTSLSQSIKTHGLAQPIVVRRCDDGYELVAGERRFRACMMAGLDMVSAIIRDMSDQDSLKIALIENLEREDLNSIEEAKGYQRLIDEFGLTHQELANSFGKSRSTISNTLRLLKLPEIIQRAVQTGDISEGHARSLLSIDDEDEMLKQFEQIRAGKLNVREIEDRVSQRKKNNDIQQTKDQPQQLALFTEIEKELTSQYEMPFKIRGGKRGGKIEIRFTNPEQFHTIYSTLRKVLQ